MSNRLFKRSALRGMVLSLAALGMGVVGCDSKESAPTAPAAPQAPTATPAAPAMPAAPAGGNVGQMMNNATDAARSAGVDLSAQAQKLFDQAQTLIKDKKWDQADEVIKQLEALKAKLPADWQAKIDSVRASFTSAKTAG